MNELPKPKPNYPNPQKLMTEAGVLIDNLSKPVPSSYYVGYRDDKMMILPKDHAVDNFTIALLLTPQMINVGMNSFQWNCLGTNLANILMKARTT